MKFRILGSAPGISIPGLHHSSLWVKTDRFSLLLDAGEGTASQLVRYNIGGNEITHIAISHFHPDHSAGLFMIIQTLYLQHRTEPLHIYLPERHDKIREILNYFYIFPQRITFNLEIHDIHDLSRDMPGIRPVFSDHLLSLESFLLKEGLENQRASFSFVCQEGNSTLIYSSDVAGCDHLYPFCENAGVLILDALHPPLKDVIECRKRVAGKMILTHGISSEISSYLDQQDQHGMERANEKTLYEC